MAAPACKRSMLRDQLDTTETSGFSRKMVSLTLLFCSAKMLSSYSTSPSTRGKAMKAPRRMPADSYSGCGRSRTATLRSRAKLLSACAPERSPPTDWANTPDGIATEASNTAVNPAGIIKARIRLSPRLILLTTRNLRPETAKAKQNGDFYKVKQDPRAARRALFAEHGYGPCRAQPQSETPQGRQVLRPVCP